MVESNSKSLAPVTLTKDGKKGTVYVSVMSNETVRHIKEDAISELYEELNSSEPCLTIDQVKLIEKGLRKEIADLD